MRVLIVDDEPAARRRLRILLEDLDVQVVGEAGDGLEALEMVADRAPDLMLLDIAMPEIDGFDVAQHLEEPRPLVVFQTAYDEYALEAFEHEALDYLVKPVSREKLERALDRARQRLEERQPRALSPDTLQHLRKLVGGGSPPVRPRLLVRERTGHRLLPFDDVVRFHADEGMVFARTRQGDDFLTDYTLKELEGRTAGRFVRANRAELVNLADVRRFEKTGDGGAALELADGTTVRVARRRTGDVRDALET